MTSKPRSKNVKLSDSCSVEDYRKLEDVQDREAIASFLEARFTERYLSPIQVEPTRKNGFTMMAIACLMIEALECFSQGKANSKRESARMFASFFRRWHGFSMFDPVSDQFYQHVRCGILHQAETTGSWRIRRAGPLLDNKTINATAFVRALQNVLTRYCDDLREQPWDSATWQAFRAKMKSICTNTEA